MMDKLKSKQRYLQIKKNRDEKYQNNFDDDNVDFFYKCVECKKIHFDKELENFCTSCCGFYMIFCYHCYSSDHITLECDL